MSGLCLSYLSRVVPAQAFLMCLIPSVSPTLTQSEKFVPCIPVHDYSSNRPSKPYAKLESGTNLVLWYDVY
jgi:hypothetical protein